MNIDELKRSYPALCQQIFAAGFNSGLRCQAEGKRDDSEQRKLEAAELIAGADKNRVPAGFARVDRDGQGYVIPTF
jgi:hypothetical protein